MELHSEMISKHSDQTDFLNKYPIFNENSGRRITNLFTYSVMKVLWAARAKIAELEFAPGAQVPIRIRVVEDVNFYWIELDTRDIEPGLKGTKLRSSAHPKEELDFLNNCPRLNKYYEEITNPFTYMADEALGMVQWNIAGRELNPNIEISILLSITQDETCYWAEALVVAG